ncbi:hypothetical protein RHGRI_011835 [Rhododendron griersonianum]|uniref:Endoglucanase n=1 Tax=Rhododendron griersonianum TaxID=479676 RepID=A0AAV6KPN4_9ERIC|nr:hypothetical protein RHGRI_011835 [Rhododendron griersonianum]
MTSFVFWCTLLVVGVKAANNAAGGFDYGNAVDKSFLFFEAQRSGRLPFNQRVKWRADSGLRDGFPQGVDLVGGYYDAGDHVKFGLPMAFSVTMLSWGAIDFRQEIVGLKQMGHTLDAIKWGTDYFIKAHPHPNILWGQVAAWLFRATKDVYYLKYVAENAASMGGTGWAAREFSWDNKYAGVQILLSKADYMLGKNPKSVSYVVGYGQTYPVHVHHRGASIASVSVLHSSVGCLQGYDTWYRRPKANPNVIHGALVGGPTKNDNFSDDRTNFEQTEPTISASAPLVGLLSKLQSVTAGNSGPHPKVAPAPSPKSDIPVEFLHSITDTWTVGRTSYYRHKVIIRNVSQKPITDLKLRFENFSGSIWGLSPTQDKNTYALPQWLKVLKPGSECSFVYIQGGPQAEFWVQSYH